VLSEDQVKDQLRGIARLVEHAAGKGTGFAAFIGPSHATSYVSNAAREDVVTVMEEWLGRTGSASMMGGMSRLPPIPQRPEEVDHRLDLERRCAEIGKVIADVTHVFLCLFDFGEGGSLAYFTSMPIETARQRLVFWIKSEKGRS
jgi:hypothetical protein